MGTEAHGTVTLGGQKVNVKADFASDHVVFSGGRRGEVKYSAIEVLGSAKGRLKLRVDGALMEFEVGDKADRLAQKIRKPPSLLDKLGLKEGQAIDERLDDRNFLRVLKEAGFEPAPGAKQLDHLFLPARDLDELGEIGNGMRRIKDTGSLWVVYRKGGRTLRETDVLEAGRSFGLKDIKVVRFSPTHTALRFVKPLVDRGQDVLKPA